MMSGEDVQETTNTTSDATEAEVVESKKALDQLTQSELVEYVRSLRKENASHRTEKQAKAKELAEFQAWKDSQKTELERSRDEAERLKAENHSLLRTSIALAAGLTPEDIEFVSGATPDEMKASAEKLASRVKGDGKKPAVTDVFAGGRGLPVTEKPKDTKTLANQWLSGLVFRD